MSVLITTNRPFVSSQNPSFSVSTHVIPFLDIVINHKCGHEGYIVIFSIMKYQHFALCGIALFDWGGGGLVLYVQLLNKRTKGLLFF